MSTEAHGGRGYLFGCSLPSGCFPECDQYGASHAAALCTVAGSGGGTIETDASAEARYDRISVEARSEASAYQSVQWSQLSVACASAAAEFSDSITVTSPSASGAGNAVLQYQFLVLENGVSGTWSGSTGVSLTLDGVTQGLSETQVLQVARPFSFGVPFSIAARVSVQADITGPCPLGSTWTQVAIGRYELRLAGVYVLDEHGQPVTDAQTEGASGKVHTNAQLVDSDGDGLADSFDSLAMEEIRSGTPPNPSAFLPGVSSAPVLGSEWDPFIDHTTFVPNAQLDVCILGFAQENLIVPGSGTLLCTQLASPSAVVAPAPGQPFSVPIPENFGLVGLEFCAQGVSLHLAGFAFANAIDVTVGSF